MHVFLGLCGKTEKFSGLSWVKLSSAAWPRMCTAARKKCSGAEVPLRACAAKRHSIATWHGSRWLPVAAVPMNWDSLGEFCFTALVHGGALSVHLAAHPPRLPWRHLRIKFSNKLSLKDNLFTYICSTSSNQKGKISIIYRF